jgi:Nif-specific regulatory protein
MSNSLSKILYIYENNACVREIEVEPGRHYLGVNERLRFQLSDSAEGMHQALARVELLKDGSASIRARRPEIDLFVNNRKIRESPLCDGDELMLLENILTWNEKKNLKGYVFADRTHTPFLIVEDGAASDVKVSSVLPQRDLETLDVSDGQAEGYGVERVARQMSSLLILSQEINRIDDQNTMIERAIDYLFSVLMIDRVAILLRTDGKEELDISRVAYRRQRPPDSIRIPSSITAQCMELKSGLLVVNAREDPRYKSKPSIIQGEICSAMALPMLLDKKIIGQLYVDSSNPAVEFSVDELKFLAVFANLITVALRNVRRMNWLERKTSALQAQQPDDPFIVGSSMASQNVYKLLQRVANSNVTVLLNGESGSGKEIAARRLHSLSKRKDEPFVAINCAAIPENLIESELFGYEKGAFTSANQSKPGKFELAEGGTLFLDEIGEIPAGFQAKLLRVLEGHGFERVGGTTTIKTQVRLVAATNRDLRHAVKNGDFREDLFYRLSVFPIKLPPLRERREDIMDLVEFFSDKFSAEINTPPLEYTDPVVELLKNYHWPGNVRELRNVVERLMILASDGVVEEDILRESLALGQLSEMSGAPADASPSFSDSSPGFNTPIPGSSTTGSPGISGKGISPEGGSLWEQEAEAIRQALTQSKGNKSQAARLLGISRHHLVYRLKKYKIDV